MSFNLDPQKQGQEVIFSCKIKKTSHPFQNHLGVYLDNKLDLHEDLSNIFKKVNRTVSLLPRALLVTIYKFFIMPHLDSEGILYDQTFNSFHEKLEFIQYNAALAITGAIKGSTREKHYQETGFESLQQQPWYQKLCLFFKIIKKQSPMYLFKLIPTARQAFMTRNKSSIPLFHVKHNYLKNFFLPSTIIEWSNLDCIIRNSDSLTIFRKLLLALIRLSANSTFNCHCPDGLKLITRLRLGLSHLGFHKFKHNFQDTLNPICSCGTVETTIHYLLYYPIFLNEKLTPFNKPQSIDENILS